MIDPKAITTYAQYNEDLILSALLHDVKKGFYVDAGASYPVVDSVTKLFYDKGWRGINIEPIKNLHQQLQEARPGDINLQCGAGKEASEAVLREYKAASGHSTFDPEQKKQKGTALEYVDYKVPIRPLKEIFEKHKVSHIHFLKIDVEGFEYDVVAGNDWKKYRPEVVCVEANHISHDWRTMLVKNNYWFFIADGLNEYYVAKGSWQRTKGFAERIVALDYHALKQHQQQSWSKDSEELLKLHKTIEEQHQQLQTQREEIRKTQSTTWLYLNDRPWISRLKRAVYGLTVDWVQYKRGNKRR